jgi:DNA-binding PadR family transcriptional regulator
MAKDRTSGSFGHNAGTFTLILSSLAGGEKHGYSLVRDVAEFAGVHIAPGTLYEALARLEKQNLIEPVESEDRRRPYRLTAEGATALADQLRAQRRIVNVGLKRLERGWTIA